MDAQQQAESRRIANKVVDGDNCQLQAKVTYRYSVLLRLKGDIKASEEIIQSFFFRA